MKKLFALLTNLFIFSFFLFVVGNKAQSAQAQDYSPMSPDQVVSEASEFFDLGADAYIMWQYSGDLIAEKFFNNDQYSWFRNVDPGPEICAALKEVASQYPDKYVGVNISNLGEKPASVIADNLSYLRNECGVNIVRTFGYMGGADGVAKVIANSADMKVIVAIGDYSNGGGGIPQGADKTWYENGYQGEYYNLVRQILGVLGDSNKIYAVELANEPHCAGDASAIDAYRNWAVDVGGFIRGRGYTAAYGQMASHAGSACDGPDFGSPSGFTQSNSVAAISKASGHYYDAAQKELVMEALNQTVGLGKTFYVGEAGWGGAASPRVRQDQYYLYPIDGLNSNNKRNIATSLIKQGYEVQCTTPKINVTAQLGGLFEYAPPAGVEVSVGAEQQVDYSSASVPVLRGATSDKLFSSLETYWGYKNPTASREEIASSLGSAPLYNLLTQQQQCVYQMSILQTVDNMCNKLTNPEKCALHKSIPSSSYTTKSLWAEVKNMLNSEYNGINKESMYSACKYLTGNSATKLSDKENDIVLALNNTPLYLDKAYRLGFLVMSAELKDNGPSGFFSFLMRGNQNANPKNEVRVIAFKIPDFGTNKDFSSDIYYDDPLTITRKALQDSYSQNKYQQNVEQERETFLQATLGNSQSALIPPITCSGDQCGGTVAQALVDMINAKGLSCEAGEDDLRAEPADRIKSSATIKPSENRSVKDGEDNYDPIEVLAEQQIDQTLSLAESPSENGSNNFSAFDFLSKIKIAPDPQGNEPGKIINYLVLPMGSEMTVVEDVLLSFVYLDEGVRSFKADANIPKYFSLQDIEQELVSQKPQISVRAPAGHDCYLNDGNCNAEAYLESEQPDPAPRILGGWLGSVTRSIQKIIHSAGSKAHEYVTACQTVEDFLLGTCTGQKIGSDLNPDMSNQCIAVWVDKDTANTYAGLIRQNLPTQQARSNFFAGWEEYFSGFPGTQHLFGQCDYNPGETCYDYILNQVIERTDSDNDGTVLNPYLAIAVALNETGGLKSLLPDKSGRHFGCGINTSQSSSDVISTQTIDKKLDCFIDFFNRHDKDGQDGNTEGSYYAPLSANEALKVYGYSNGYRNKNLNKIIGILTTGPTKDTNYEAVCPTGG